jgi:hypothetical protein
MLSLLLALAGSYLVLTEQVKEEASAPVVTDITFPDDLGIPSAASFPRDDGDGWFEQWPQRWAGDLLERTRAAIARRRS